MDTPTLHDVVILGGSYAGLSAAMQLGRARRSTLVIDTGLTRNRFAPTAHGFFGHDGTAPADMIRVARQQVAAYPSISFRQDEAVGAVWTPDGFAVTLAGGATVRSRKVILAFGVEDMLPDIPGVPERWGRSVLHCPYCHGYELNEAPVGVIAIGPMATHQALIVADWGPVTLFTNGREDVDSDARARLTRRGVQLVEERVAALEGEGTALAGVRLADGRLIPLAAVFIGAPIRLRSGIAEALGCTLDAGPLGPFIKIDDVRQTVVPGVYAAGDITRAMHNATLASGDGVLAGVAAHQALIAEALAASI